MPEAAGDPVGPDATGGGSGAGARRASALIRRIVVATAAVALALVHVLSASADTLAGKVVRVADGDTITILDASMRQHRIRLMGIDAPETKQPFGRKSHESLASMVAGRNVELVWHKRDRYGRIVGQVFADSRDVGLVQIERGMAWHYKAYEREQRSEDARAYAQAEVVARCAGAALWSDSEPVPPWVWRKHRRAARLVARPAPPGPSNPLPRTSCRAP